MELGISTFGEVLQDKANNAYQRTQDLLAEIKLADDLGLDVFAVGEHHRPDYLVAAPEVVLAAAAAITKNIRLSSSVTVLSSADPVRTYQNFATLDLISGGRAEIMAGRGSFIESFPLFGYDLEDYDSLFTEKLDMLLRINEQEKITWKGKHRAAINNLGVYPRAYQEKLPIWLAVGGTPASAVRAGTLNLPMTIAILGGNPTQFVPFVNLYRQSAEKAGHDVSKLQLAINEHFYIADDAQQAADEFFPIYAAVMNKVGKERGWSPLTRPQFDYMIAEGPLLVGTPQQVINKLTHQYSYFNNTRFLVQLITGKIEHSKIMRSIELFGSVVAPALRQALK